MPVLSFDTDKTEAKAERGQGIVEFALVIALLLLLVFGIIDFSRLFFAYATMSNGVREGARYAIVHPNDEAGIKSAARAMMIVIGGEVELDVSFPDTDSLGNPGCRESFCRVVVTASSDFPVWTPIIPGFPIEAKATMHVE
jgi:hypothetical protein